MSPVPFYQSATFQIVDLWNNERLLLKRFCFRNIRRTSGEIKTLNLELIGRNCRRPHWTDSDWKDGNVPKMNVKNPLIKDTIAVPRKGYVVLRFVTDNPGTIAFTFNSYFIQLWVKKIKLIREINFMFHIANNEYFTR